MISASPFRRTSSRICRPRTDRHGLTKLYPCQPRGLNSEQSILLTQFVMVGLDMPLPIRKVLEWRFALAYDAIRPTLCLAFLLFPLLFFHLLSVRKFRCFAESRGNRIFGWCVVVIGVGVARRVAITYELIWRRHFFDVRLGGKGEGKGEDELGDPGLTSKGWRMFQPTEERAVVVGDGCTVEVLVVSAEDLHISNVAETWVLDSKTNTICAFRIFMRGGYMQLRRKCIYLSNWLSR